MKRSISLVLALLAAVAVWADEQRTAVVAIRYDLDSVGTLIYCRSVGQNGSPYGPPISVAGRLVTSGSSTTVTTVGGASNAFGPMAAGDVLIVNRAGTIDTAVITAKATDNSVTVDAAVNWDNSAAGYAATWRDTQCGTAITDGWIDVSGATRITFNTEFNRGDIDNFSFRVECRTGAQDANPVRAFPSATSSCGSGTLATGHCDFAAALAGIDGRFSVVAYEPWNSCRIGMKAKTSDASDAGANLEQIGASIVTAYAW
jgi:hypothetical protein